MRKGSNVKCYLLLNKCAIRIGKMYQNDTLCIIDYLLLEILLLNYEL